MKISDIKATMLSKEQVITGVVRLAFVKITEPDEQSGKYTVCVILDKEKCKDTIECIEKAVESATARGIVEKWGGKKPKMPHPVLKDSNDREDDQYAGFDNAMYLNARSKSKPEVLNRRKERIPDTEIEDEIYSGVYAVVSLTLYPYANDNTKGVGVALNNIMKIKDGEKLAGKPKATTDFAAIDLDDDEFEDDDL